MSETQSESPKTRPRVYVDFKEAKRLVTVPDVLAACGLLERFERRGETLSGVCPLPSHQHGPYPNPEQWKARVRDGLWLWHCFGDCQRGGDSIELAKLLLGLSNEHVRLWLAEHFADRLTLKRPQSRSRDEPPDDDGEPEPPTKEARPEAATSERAESNASTEMLPAAEPPIKPLRFSLRLDPSVPYLRQRGLTEETIRRYGLGLCSKGLLQGYVAIPVYGLDNSPNPLAYLGRWPGEDHDEAAGWPRYKWPPGFPKHRVLYGLREALQTPAGQPLVVVEGPFGLYHLVQAGFPATVAVCGSDLSGEQAASLVALGRQLVLLFDGDVAGRKGACEAAARLIPYRSVRVVRLPDGVQPDDMPADEIRSFLYSG